MADRKVKVTLEADAGPMVSGFRKAEASVKGFSSSFEKNRAAWDEIGDTALIAGGAIAAGLGLAAKAAIDWESAWAGVAKTVDGTPAQMRDLESGLRDLTHVLPATHDEIAGVAEAAGQLGVATPDIVDFTKVAIDLGESTNLSAEEAATGLAKFSNIMGTASRDGVEGYSRMGSALVALGNDGASTEKDILDMSLRLAGAGKQAGASESDILAMANALTSVGIEAELGGGAMSRAMLKMNTAVISGGDELEKFAEIAGMSAQEFAVKWRKDPIGAVNAFIGGLGRIGDSGGDASAALESVGLAGTQNAQVLLRAAGSSDLMTKSLKLGKKAWRENSALAEEASRRYETTESKMQIAVNTLKDAAIDLGATFGPMLAKVAGWAADAANAFVKLPGPVKEFVAALGAISATGLIGGGLAIKAVGFANDMTKAFRDVGLSMDRVAQKSPRAARGMDRVAGAARGVGRAGMGLAAAAPIIAAFQEDLGQIGSQQLIRDLDGAANGLDTINSAIQKADGGTSDVQNLGKALQVAFDPNWVDNAGKGIDGFFSVVTFGAREADGEIAQSNRRLSELDTTLAQMVSGGDAAGAADMFRTIAAEAKKQGISVEELKRKFPQYAEAVAGAENATRNAADGADKLNGGLSEQEQAAQEAQQAIADLRDELTQLGGGFRAEQAAARQVQESLKGLDEVVKSGKGGWSELSAAMSDAAEDALDYAGAQAEMGRGSDEIAAGISRVREQVIQSGVDSGKSRAFMERYADSIGLIPSEARTMVEAAGVKQSTTEILGMKESIMLLNGKTVTVKEAGAMASQGRVKGLDMTIRDTNGKTVHVKEIGATASGERVVIMNGKIKVLKGKNVKVTEHGATNATDRVTKLFNSIDGGNGKDVLVTEHGATPAQKRVHGMFRQIGDLFGKDVNVTEHGADPAKGRVRGLDDSIRGTDGKSVDVNARVNGKWDVDSLVNSIGNVRSKTVTVTSIARKVGKWFADGGIEENGPGGLHSYMASGGTRSFAGQSPHIRPAGGGGVTWAEQGAGPWEAWISGHPAKRARSLAILDDVASRFGRAVVEPSRFADGGTWESYRNFQTATPPPVVVRESGGGSQYAGPTAGDMEAAMSRAVSGMRVNFSIGDRDLVGVISRAQTRQKGR